MSTVRADLTTAFEGTLVNEPNFLIKLATYAWKVDLDLLAGSSEFFANIRKNKEFKEYQMKTVILHDEDPELFATALQFIYYGTYNPKCDERTLYTIQGETRCHEQTGASINDILIGGKLILGDSEPRVSSIQDPNEIEKIEKALALHFLAKKYQITALADQTLETILAWQPTDVDDIKDVFSKHINSLHVADLKMRRFLGKVIADNYSQVRGRSTESTRIIYQWLEQDVDLTLEVCEGFQARTVSLYNPFFRRGRGRGGYDDRGRARGRGGIRLSTLDSP